MAFAGPLWGLVVLGAIFAFGTLAQTLPGVRRLGVLQSWPRLGPAVVAVVPRDRRPGERADEGHVLKGQMKDTC